MPEVVESLRRTMGASVVGRPPQRFATHQGVEIDRWTPVLRAAGIRAE